MSDVIFPKWTQTARQIWIGIGTAMIFLAGANIIDFGDKLPQIFTEVLFDEILAAIGAVIAVWQKVRSVFQEKEKLEVQTAVKTLSFTSGSKQGYFLNPFKLKASA